MKLFFEITSGDRQGSRFEIRDGLTIGRKQADIIVRDSKVSSRHAIVEERDSGLFLVDAGSSNGLKVEGIRAKEVQLINGVAIQLGRTQLVVIDVDEVGSAPEKPVFKTWQDGVAGVIDRLARAFEEKNSRSQGPKVYPFARAVELKAVAGPQAGQSWTLVYGPREIGAESLDIRLLEDGIPKVAFHILQSSDGVMLKTQHADVISVNGAKGKSNLTLRDGDEIEVYNTRLKVKLLDL